MDTNHINSYIDSMLDGTRHMNAFEAENKVISSLGGIAPTIDANAARSLVQARMRNRSGGQAGSGFNINGQTNPRLAAEFNIKVDRQSADITQSLIVPIFGWLETPSGYAELLAQYNTGLTFTVQIGHYDLPASPKVVRITYDDGVNTDIVEVSCNTFPYTGILHATATGILKMENVQYEISDNANTQQFKETFDHLRKSMFGLEAKNSIPIYKDPRQFQDGIVRVQADLTIDRETTLMLGVGEYADFQVNLGCFISQFSK